MDATMKNKKRISIMNGIIQFQTGGNHLVEQMNFNSSIQKVESLLNHTTEITSHNKLKHQIC